LGLLGLLGLLGCATSGPVQPPPQQKGVLSGTVTSRADLPPNAQVTVRVWDALEPPSVAMVGETKFQATGQGPLPFELFFDPGLIQQTHPYGARARISLQGVLLYETETPVSVLTQGAPTVGVELPVKRVAPLP
jgi:putative lipoprotein